MESQFIEWLRHRLGEHACLRLGPGDDAAILRLADRGDCVVTVDLLTDGVDFELGSVDPRRIGRKALAVNLSDLAAMAAKPLAVVIALALPRDGALELAQSLYEGLLPLAERYGVVIAGGDTNTWGGSLAISITAIGQTTELGPLLRSGAQPGDWILATGQFGGSILGHHFDFEPRVREALLLNSRYQLHAGMDVSDGLSLDLSRMAKESGCGAVIELASVPIAPAAVKVARQWVNGMRPLDHALCDGEDFELILAVASDEAKRILGERPLDIPLTQIGYFVADCGLWSIDAFGNRQTLEPRGYEHL